MRTELVPGGFPAREEILAEAHTAARRLRLHERLSKLTLVLDAPEFEGGGFWSVELEPDGGVLAILYGSPLDVLHPAPRGGDRQLGLDEDRLSEVPAERVDRLRADRWIYRNLLQLDDLLSRRVDPEKISRSRSTAFQTCWDVWTDGRLKGRSMPGISQAERRGVFFRTFAAGGLLLPRHWAIFHDLWEGRLADQTGLMQALAELPPPK